MQVQQTCNYYPYSPLATASLGADSNNSSPESVHADYRPFVHHHHQQYQQQQRSHQLMDSSSPLTTHQHLHCQQVQARRQQQSYEEQYYNQEIDGYDDGLMNGSYVGDQQRHWHQQPQQQQPQQQQINRYPGYSSPPVANFVQQQQVYAQPQLSPSQQLPHQVYPESYPFVDPTPNFVAHQLQQPIVGKQRVAATARAKSNKRKRKATPDDDDDGLAKMAKLEMMPPPPPMTTTTTTSGCDDESSERLTASMRERQRTQELNNAYNQLRQTIPCLPSDKLSKIQTVRLATKYIEFLFRLLQFNAMPEAVRHAHASPKTAVLASALEIVESTKMTPNPVPSHEKLSYAFSVWRMDNEMTGTTRVE